MATRKNPLSFVLVMLLPVAAVFAQEEAAERSGGFWVCPGAETAMYSPTGMTSGGSLSLGYGRGASIGIRAAYLFNTEGLTALELNFLLRLYILKSLRYSGPFVQFIGGPVFFATKNDTVVIPAKIGTISAGLTAGWRFLLGNMWFVEPSIRGGYPYRVGGGLSAGFHL